MDDFLEMLAVFIMLIGIPGYMLWIHNWVGILVFISGISIGVYFGRPHNNQ